MARFTAKIRKDKKGYISVSVPRGAVEKLKIRHGDKADFEIKGRDDNGNNY